VRFASAEPRLHGNPVDAIVRSLIIRPRQVKPHGGATGGCRRSSCAASRRSASPRVVPVLAALLRSGALAGRSDVAAPRRSRRRQLDPRFSVGPVSTLTRPGDRCHTDRCVILAAVRVTPIVLRLLIGARMALWMPKRATVPDSDHIVPCA
jgi:hypothetical protein